MTVDILAKISECYWLAVNVIGWLLIDPWSVVDR